MVLEFLGDVFTSCNGGVAVGTAPYYAVYKDEIRTAISIFRSVGASVVLIGQPADSTARLTRNGSALNQLYRSIAKATTGVTYDDAGQAVMAKGRFTWTLPCLSGEPCTGPHGTNIVRAPDGIHFCPNGKSTPDQRPRRLRRLLLGCVPLRLGHAEGRARFPNRFRTLSTQVRCSDEQAARRGRLSGHTPG